METGVAAAAEGNADAADATMAVRRCTGLVVKPSVEKERAMVGTHAGRPTWKVSSTIARMLTCAVERPS